MPINRRRGEVQQVALQSGTSLPVRIRLWGIPASFHVRAGRTANGPVLLGLEVQPDRGEVITAELLKQIPARRLAAAAARLLVHPRDDEIGGQLPGPDFVNFQRPEQNRDPGPNRRGRPVHYGAEHYAEVAREAMIARANGDSASAAVAAKFGIEPSTAYRHIAKARELGLIDRHRAAPKARQKEMDDR